jgi:hypothetical protein
MTRLKTMNSKMTMHLKQLQGPLSNQLLLMKITQSQEAKAAFLSMPVHSFQGDLGLRAGGRF